MAKVLLLYSTRWLAVKLKCFFPTSFFRALNAIYTGGIIKSCSKFWLIYKELSLNTVLMKKIANTIDMKWIFKEFFISRSLNLLINLSWLIVKAKKICYQKGRCPSFFVIFFFLSWTEISFNLFP